MTVTGYSFPRARHEAILAGAQDLTLRKPSARRQARIGEPLAFTQGAAGPVFARATCVLHAVLVFSPDGLRRALAPTYVPPGDGLFRLLLASEQHVQGAAEHQARLAGRLGFDDWASFYAAHEKWPVDNHAGPWRIGQLVGWAGVQPEAGHG